MWFIKGSWRIKGGLRSNTLTDLLGLIASSFLKRLELSVNSETIDWRIYLVAVVKVMRDYLSRNLCPMRLLQNTYFTISQLVTFFCNIATSCSGFQTSNIYEF